MLASHRVTSSLLVLVLITGLGIVAMLASGVRGGPLDPTGAPAPTGKTLEEIPGSWSRVLSANDGAAGPNPPAGCNSSRFQCVFGNAAVLDRETGLVWTRDANSGAATLGGARAGCYSAVVGGRLGWRLPTMDELSSLYDGGASGLPLGHPFTNLATALNGEYWTATPATSTIFWVFFFGNGGTSTKDTGTTVLPAWCVRGTGGQVTASP